MKRWMFLPLLLVCAFVQADMVEVKDQGFLNGEVVSDDGKIVQFKDAKGKMHRYDKKNVTFMEIDKNDTGKATTNLGKELKRKAEKALEAAKKAPEALKKATDGATKNFTDTVGKPIDRSAADAQGASLAHVMDDASKATAGMTKKVGMVNAETARQQNEAKGPGEKKGRFESL